MILIGSNFLTCTYRLCCLQLGDWTWHVGAWNGSCIWESFWEGTHPNFWYHQGWLEDHRYWTHNLVCPWILRKSLLSYVQGGQEMPQLFMLLQKRLKKNLVGSKFVHNINCRPYLFVLGSLIWNQNIFVVWVNINI